MQQLTSLGHVEAQRAIQAIQDELTRRGKPPSSRWRMRMAS